MKWLGLGNTVGLWPVVFSMYRTPVFLGMVNFVTLALLCVAWAKARMGEAQCSILLM